MLDLARARNLEVARVLAYAIAHEMGHLLLPYPSHAINGIMHEAWNGGELREMGTGSLRFTPAQASAIRAKASEFGHHRCRRDKRLAVPQSLIAVNLASGQTKLSAYGDLVKQAIRLNRMKQGPLRVEHGRYITFISDFMAANRKAAHADARTAWKEIKAMDAPKTSEAWVRKRGRRSAG